MFTQWTDDHFAAWLAGFFDGEGNIYMPDRGLNLTIANTNRAIIEGIQERTGVGAIQEVVYDRQNWQTKYAWRVRSYPENGIVLRLIRPFLVLKAEQADAALARIQFWEDKRTAFVERNQAIVAAALDGTMYKDIAERFGISRQMVANVVTGVVGDGTRQRPHVRELRRVHQQHQKVSSTGVATKCRKQGAT